MKKTFAAISLIACGAAIFVPSANAAPSQELHTVVITESPAMVCQVDSYDYDLLSSPPDVWCQTKDFPRAPALPVMNADGTVGPETVRPTQAGVTAAGKLQYNSGNIGMGGDDENGGERKFATMTNGQTYALQGWTVAPSADGITFTNDGTGHGMTIDDTYRVTPF